jgi:uncharacterized membrane protein
MSEHEPFDVLIGIYLIPDYAQQEFDALVGLVKDKTVKSEGIILVNKGIDGKVEVTETGDHMGRKGAEILGGAGFVVGLFAPPLLAATVGGAAIGALAGKFAAHKLKAGIGEKMDESLPPHSAAVVAVYDHDHHDLVDATLANAVKKSTSQIDKASVKELKAGLAEAGAGLAG